MFLYVFRRNLITSVLSLVVVISPAFSQVTIKVDKGVEHSAGATIIPTWQRINTWGPEHTNPFLLPVYRYPFTRETNLMNASGGRAEFSPEMYRTNGIHNYSPLLTAIQNLIDSNITAPIIVLGSTPDSLSDMPGEKGAFLANIGAPNDYLAYSKYVGGLVKAIHSRFPNHFSGFKFKLYTEPDNYGWWHRGFVAYKELYDITLGAMRDSLRSVGVTPILHPGNLMAPLPSAANTNAYWPWTPALAQWLSESHSGQLVDAFNGTLSNWEVTGSVTVSSGEMRINNGRALSTLNNFRNFNYSLTMRSPINGGASWKVGWVIFKYTSNDNYWYALLHDDVNGTLEVGRRQNGVNTTLGYVSTQLSPKLNRTFRIRSFCDTVDVFVDNRRYVQTYSPNSGEGKVGVWAWDGAPDVRVDNVLGEQTLLGDNFVNGSNWTSSNGSFTVSDGTLSLGASSSAITSQNYSGPLVFKANMRTVNPGSNSWQTGWLVFDYSDNANYSAFLLHNDGFVEYGYRKAGVWNALGRYWTGLPRPFVSESFQDHTLKSMYPLSTAQPSFINGELKLNAGNIMGGYTDPTRTSSYRFRATVRTENPNPNSPDQVAWVIFNYVDVNNFWAVNLRSNVSRELRLLRRSSGVYTEVGRVSTNLSVQNANRFDIRVGGDTLLVAGIPGWQYIQDNITVIVNGVQYFKSVYTGGSKSGRFGVWAWGQAPDVRVDNILTTYETSQSFSPTDWHTFEVTKNGRLKTLVIDGITVAMLDQPNAPTGGKFGFWAWETASNVQIRNVSITQVAPSHPAAIPRFPAGTPPEISMSAYGFLSGSDATQMGGDPQEIATRTNSVRAIVQPYLPAAIYSVAEGALYTDENGRVMEASDGTELGAAWNAALIKNMLDAGLNRFSQWGHTSDRLKTPTFNVFQMFEKMRGNVRVRVTRTGTTNNYVDAVASRSGDRVRIVVFHYQPNRIATGSVNHTVSLTGLIGNRNYRIEHSRVDKNTSNFFTKWLAYRASNNLSPKTSKSIYDVNIRGAYDASIINNHWVSQRSLYDMLADDELRMTHTSTFTSTASGTANLTLSALEPNTVVYYEIFPI